MRMKILTFLFVVISTGKSLAGLVIRQGRVINTPQTSVEIFPIIGIATVELGGDIQIVNFFDCITDLNNGSGLVWTRRTTQHRFDVGPIPDGSPGRRLRAAGISYSDLDVYTCSDRYSNDFSSINITNANPAIMAVQERVGVVQHSTAELEVYVSGYPPPTPEQIMWYRPGNFEVTDSDEGVVFQEGRRSLVLSNLQPQQAGQYTCVVVLSRSPNRHASTQIQLDIYVPPTFVTHPQETVDAVEWREITLNCSASGSPTSLITWEREGQTQLPVGAVTSPPSVNGNTTTSWLIFSMVRHEDGGRYRCVADNFETNATLSQYADIRITPILRFADDGAQPIITDLYFVEEMSHIRLECFGTGNLQWTSSTGLEIPSDRSGDIYQSYDHTRDALALVIQNFTISNTAVYTCVSDLTDVFNSNPISLSLFLTNSNPAVFIQSRVQYVLAGNSTTLEATVYASPADLALVQWYHERTFINTLNETGYTASQHGDIHTLEIESVSENELGEYTIVVTLEGLNATDDIILKFLVPPSANVTPSLISVIEEDEVTFLCVVDGFGHQFTLDWSLANGGSLPPGVQQNGRELVISAATRSHAGLYVCSVSNAAGTVQVNITLLVYYVPTAVISFNGLTSMPGQRLHLVFDEGAPGPSIACSADGYLPPTVEWIKDNGRSLPSEVAQQNGNGDIQLLLRWERPLKFSDSGCYVCLASNNIGIGNVTVEILLQNEPTISDIYPSNSSTQSDAQSPSATTGVFRIVAIVSGLIGAIMLIFLVGISIVLSCVYMYHVK